MNTQTLAQYMNVPEGTAKQLMGLSARQLLADETYIGLLYDLDRELLEATLPTVRAVYEEYLPEFIEGVESRYNLDATPMSAFTLGNWVVGALQFPEHTHSILEMHANVPREVFNNELQSLMDILENTPEGKAEWQRAMCVFALPLMRS
jgi:hypothetical protein